MCIIDASKVIEKLGLKEPVVFEFESLSDNELLGTMLADGQVSDGRTHPTPDGVHHITIDIDAAHFMGEDLRKTVAHELVHCQQVEAAGSYLRATIQAVYENTHLPYTSRPSEIEAEHRAEELMGLITLTECDSSYPLTASQVRDEINDMLPRLEVKYGMQHSIADIVAKAAKDLGLEHRD